MSMTNHRWARSLVACVMALVIAACGRQGGIGHDIDRESWSIDSAQAIIASLEDQDIDHARSILSRHMAIANSKAFDSSKKAIFLSEFSGLRYAHKALNKWHDGLNNQQWSETLDLFDKQFRDLKNDWQHELRADSLTLQHLSTERQLLWPLLQTIVDKGKAATWVMANQDSLDAHFQMRWDNWENTTL